jgi:hypothetical protein
MDRLKTFLFLLNYQRPASRGLLAWLLCALGGFLAFGDIPIESLKAETTAAWHPADNALMTRWAADVSPTNVHAEYPRPQLVRPDWQNLNGLWDYAITPLEAARPVRFDGNILVPFPLESSLSGVKQHLDENSILWYHRRFKIPSAWAGRQVRLHFGAVDWRSRIIINGQEVGQHAGGFDPFSFDLTPALNWTNEEDIVLAVTDPTEGDQPRGKQSRNPEGIFYTPTSGIWQTVWLEPVPTVCIDSLKFTPDLDTHTLRLQVAVNSLADAYSVEAVATVNGREVGRVVGAPNEELSLIFNEVHPWSPNDPFLYDLKVTLKDRGNAVDTVTSYFALRKISLRKDDDGVTRMALNDQFLFQMGVLDQGFWPDGIYTAPTDEALRSDIEYLKRAGFNLVRKHAKVEPDRWYYWCDKLGLLVWQDMPSGNNATVEGRTQFEGELQRMVDHLSDHPSIIVWVLFNEGWGQYDTERLVPWLKSLDPSRLIDNASGWTDKQVGDIIDAHSYPTPESPAPESGRAAVLGEFGGLGLGLPGHLWSDKFWGYLIMTNEESLSGRYTQLLDRLHDLRDSVGLSAAIYTQLSDVETECNGLLTYDRAMEKLNAAAARVANNQMNTNEFFRVIVPDALYDRVNWKYTTKPPVSGWTEATFDDHDWEDGTGGFGTYDTPGAIINTVWNTDDIWLRREFRLGQIDLQTAELQVHHDEDAEIYLNGVLAAKVPGFVASYGEIKIEPDALATLKAGQNFMAVHCHQTAGGQYIDVGIVTRRARAVTPAAPEH